MVVCSSCGQENPAGARFCMACAAPLGADVLETHEERKTISVVFVDLVGFTARSEELDPEDVRSLLTPYHERVRDELQRYGGTVEKFIGDAVMAVFGAPAAHEDDAERAVRAALAIREWAATSELNVRIGVNTGDALVTVGARAEAGQSFVAGDVVNTAARLQAAAPVGGILVGERTEAATRDAIRYGEPGAVEAKGKAAPVRVWAALEATASTGVDVTAGASGPLVGRDREVELLSSLLRGIVEDRGAQLLTLVGVPGIGKSRLVAELYRLVDEAPELIAWRQGRCLSYGDGIAFWALGEIVKAEAGILETDGSEEAFAKLGAAVGRLTDDAGEARWLDQELRRLVGLAEGSSTQAGAGAWRRFLEAMADRGPAVIVFEDVHWADDGLLDFIDELVEWLRSAPLLVIATARPELLERRPAWGGGKANATTVSLQPLRDEETVSLIGSLLERPVQDADERQALLERAGGNPLFAGQYVRMLAERGSAGGVPDSVQGVIAARLDALPAREKALVQEAAVYGKVFWTGAVAASLAIDEAGAEELLRALERKDFVRRERRSTVAGDTQYAFHHVLLRDVAYGQIPRRLRAEKHRRAAEWTAALGRPDELAELIAYHYQQALELGRATGAADDPQLVKAALQALRAAGDRAVSLGAYGSAAEAFADALALAGDDEEGAELQLLYARALWRLGEDRGAIEEALRRFEKLGDRRGAAQAEALAASLAWERGDRVATDRHLAAALEHAGTEPTRVRAEVLARQAGLDMLAGRFDESVRVGSDAIRILDSLGLGHEYRSVLVAVATARCCLGDTGGLDALEEVSALAESEGSFNVAALAAGNLSSELHFYGRLADARRAWLRGNDLATAYGLGRHLKTARSDDAAWAYLEGDWERALAEVDELVAEAEAGRPSYTTAIDISLRTWIRLARGEPGGADDIARAVAFARASDAQAQAAAFPSAAAINLALGQHADADRLANDVLGIGTVLVPALCSGFPTLADVAWVFRDLERGDELRERILDATPIRSPWNDAARAILDGDFVLAGDTIERIGHRASAAFTRYRAAADALAAGGRDAEADAERAKAAPFMEAAGITSFPLPGRVSARPVDAESAA